MRDEEGRRKKEEGRRKEEGKVEIFARDTQCRHSESRHSLAGLIDTVAM
jgi:hypothetical protein